MGKTTEVATAVAGQALGATTVHGCEARRLSLDWWAAQLGLSRRHLNREIARGNLAAVRTAGRTLVLEEDMRAYLDAHKQPAGQGRASDTGGRRPAGGSRRRTTVSRQGRDRR